MKKRNKIKLSSEKDDTIILLGGSFNPIHLGHLKMAESAYKQYLHPIVLLPNKSTYYKDNSSFASDEDRLNMLELVCDENDFLYYSDIEIIRGGVTHTVDTVRELKKAGFMTIYFIIGGDSLKWVDKWVDADELLESAVFLSAVRGETDKDSSAQIISRIKKEHPLSDIRLLDMNDTPISSADIRKKVIDGKSIKGLVSDSIERYIAENKLYKNNN